MALGADKLLQITLVVSTGRSMVPFLTHNFALLPAFFTVTGFAVLYLLVVCVFFILGDRNVEVFQVTSKSAFLRANMTNASDVSGVRALTFPVEHEFFCRVVITQASIYAAALFCAVAWLFASLERSWRLYLVPMFHDMRLVEATLWPGFEDWSALDIVEQDKHIRHLHASSPVLDAQSQNRQGPGSSSFLFDKPSSRARLHAKSLQHHQQRERQRQQQQQQQPPQQQGFLGMSSTVKKAANGAPATVVRTSRAPNTIVVLHVEDAANATSTSSATAKKQQQVSSAPVVTLDLCIRKADDNNASGLLVKSMARDPNEEAAKTLDRIQLLFAPPRGKGTAAKKQTRADMLAGCPSVCVLGSASDTDDSATLVELDTSLPNGEFWKRARVLTLGSERVTVKYNVPTITDIVPPSKPFVGLPLVCSNITNVFTEASDLKYEWCLKMVSDGDSGEEGVTVLSTEAAFEPGPELLGKSILLRVTPDVATGLWTQVELQPVQMPPPPVERWQETTSNVSFPAFRVVTYNILYDDFCTSKSCKAKIYPFATDDVLDIENRQVRILQELLAYHADVICLQECGKKLFAKYLLPAMAVRGYDGFYANKSGNVQEGCGFLFRKGRFSLAAAEVVPLSWRSLEELEPTLAAQIAGTHAELQEALANVTSIGCILTLKEVGTGRKMLLGNTHLFYHANGCHIRILQMYLLLASLRRAAAAAGGAGEGLGDAKGKGEKLPIVLCGDCNCTHSTGAYRLVTTGQVEDTHHSWEKGKLFWWGCDRQLGYSEDQLAELMDGSEAAGSGQPKVAPNADSPVKKQEKEKPHEVLTDFFHDSLHVGVKLTDAYDRTDPSLPWTNFTLTFREVIDYIFFSDESLDVVRTIPIPPESELAENYALPNAKYPSDHVALIADLTFKY